MGSAGEENSSETGRPGGESPPETEHRPPSRDDTPDEGGDTAAQTEADSSGGSVSGAVASGGAAARQRSPLMRSSVNTVAEEGGAPVQDDPSPSPTQHVYIEQPPVPPPAREVPADVQLGSSVGSASGLTDELSRFSPAVTSSAAADSAPLSTSMILPSAALPCPIHGFSAELCALHYCCVRHSRWPTGGKGAEGQLVSKWRQKERLKTSSVALVLCLNIGVDPPDVIKITPCARLECWVDPLVMQNQKALETIGKNLQAQYERWQPRAKYKTQLDPTVDDLKKLCVTARRTAKGERMLFHYNGHGVPRPTVNGEIWVFNKNYTQYIPLSVYDLQAWVGTPAIYVFDCSAAGLVVNTFKMLMEQRTSASGADATQGGWGSGVPPTAEGGAATKEIILLAACGSTELLPQSPELPADVFTACLTTPIKVALRWFCSRSLLRNEGFTKDQIDRIPGKQTDRKTLLGELNWIFTAITDTIAWNVLPRTLFQKLFRQDLLVASLFRNFLLVERIMRAANCSPVSYPHLPPTHQHPMWQAWDMAAERCLAQLPQLLNDPNAEFQPSSFFSEQLTAFEIWLQHGSKDKRPPEQLPIVLQVLLSQVHRMRALLLLGRFVDMGSWAVDLALSVGIFPYVLKLLQTTATDLRQILVFIWTKILALDRSCQVDLVKDNGHLYFIKFLDSSDPAITSSSRAMAAFVLAVICDGHAKGQMLCANSGLQGVVLSLLPPPASASASTTRSPILLKWLLLCLGKLCENMPEIAAMALQDNAAHAIAPMLTVDDPEVRAAAVYAMGCLIMVPNVSGMEAHSAGGSQSGSALPDSERLPVERAIACYLIKVVYDASPLVRAEVAVALARIVAGHYVMVHDELMNQVRSNAKARRRHSRQSLHHSPTEGSGPAYSQSIESTASSDAGGRSRPGSVGDEGGAVLGAAAAAEGSAAARDSSDGAPLSSSLGIAVASRGGLLTPSLLSSDGDANPATNGGWASADAARVGGGIYEHLCQAIYLLALDPTPQVASAGRSALEVANVELSAVPSHDSAPAERSGSSSMHGGSAAARSMDLFRRSIGLGGSASVPPLAPPPSERPPPSFSSSTPRYVLRRIRNASAPPVSYRTRELSTQSSLDPSTTQVESMSVQAERQVSSAPDLTEYAATATLPSSLIYALAAEALSSPLLPPGGGDIACGEIRIPKVQVDLARMYAQDAHDPIAREAQRSESRSGALSGLKLRENIVTFETDCEGTVALALSPFEPLLTSVDYQGQARTYSCRRVAPGARPVNSFHLCSGELLAPPAFSSHGDSEALQPVPPSIDVTYTFHLNELHGAGLLGVCALDGSVRIWRNHTVRGHQTRVSAWQAVPRPPVLEAQSSSVAGAVFEYSAASGMLFAAGGTKPRCLHAWDLARETCIQQVAIEPWSGTGASWSELTHRSSAAVVERLASVRDEPLLAVGCIDGSVQLLDLRCPLTPVAGFLDAHAPGARLSGLAMGLGADGRQLVTACSGGSLKFWDVRGAGGAGLVRAVEAHSASSGLTCLATHPAAPLLATGTKTHTVKVWNAYGDLVGAIRAAGGFLGSSKGGAISCLAFHPLELKLAAGGDTSVIALYTVDAAASRLGH